MTVFKCYVELGFFMLKNGRTSFIRAGFFYPKDPFHEQQKAASWGGSMLCIEGIGEYRGDVQLKPAARVPAGVYDPYAQVTMLYQCCLVRTALPMPPAPSS